MSSATPKIVLYSSTICPWAARTWTALEHVKAKYDFKEIDLANKPDWFVKASPTGKVPTLAIGDEGTILVESAITTRFVAETFPEAGLISSNPLVNAQSELWSDRYIALIASRFFISITKIPENERSDEFFKALDEALPFLLLGPSGDFAANQKTPLLGDLLVVPFIARIHLFIDKGLLGADVAKKLEQDSKYADYSRYVKALLTLPAHTKIFDGDAIYKWAHNRIFNQVAY